MSDNCQNCEELNTELAKWKYLAKSFYETRFNWDNAEFEWACKRYEELDK
jgi:hypothetical protein